MLKSVRIRDEKYFRFVKNRRKIRTKSQNLDFVDDVIMIEKPLTLNHEETLHTTFISDNLFEEYHTIDEVIVDIKGGIGAISLDDPIDETLAKKIQIALTGR